MQENIDLKLWNLVGSSTVQGRMALQYWYELQQFISLEKRSRKAPK